MHFRFMQNNRTLGQIFINTTKAIDIKNGNNEYNEI